MLGDSVNILHVPQEPHTGTALTLQQLGVAAKDGLIGFVVLKVTEHANSKLEQGGCRWGRGGSSRSWTRSWSRTAALPWRACIKEGQEVVETDEPGGNAVARVPLRGDVSDGVICEIEGNALEPRSHVLNISDDKKGWISISERRENSSLTSPRPKPFLQN